MGGMTGPFLYTSPQSPASATGVVADVYAQVSADFGVKDAPTFVALSASPSLLTSTWALMRESLLAGRASRTGKELVAAGVSLANRCPFCVTAHAVLLHATGDHRLAEGVLRGEEPEAPGDRALLAWGRNMRGPWPFPADEAPEYVGTTLAFHFINRIVSSLLSERMLPGGAERYRLVRRTAGRSLAGTVRREVRPGASLPLLRTDGEAPAWMDDGPVGTAYGALLTAARAGEELLSEEDAASVRASVADWDGVTPLPLRAELPSRARRPGARLALLAARAPYRVTAEDVAAWRTPASTDHCLVHLVAFGAICAVERVEAILRMTVGEPI